MVTGGEGLIELSHCDPSQYYLQDITLRLTAVDTNYYNLQGTFSGMAFQGLGSDAYPFEGSLHYLVGSEYAIISDHALFNTLSTKAAIVSGLKIVPNIGANQNVLATHVVADSANSQADWSICYQADDDTLAYVNAGLVGIVDENAKVGLEISYAASILGANLNSLTITNTMDAALFVDTIKSGAEVSIDASTTLPTTTVTSQQNAGLFAGSVQGLLAITNIQSSFSSSYVISGGTNSGLLAGFVEEASVTVDASVHSSAVVSTTKANGNAGGIIGYAGPSSTIDLSGVWQIDGNVSASGNNSNAGGAIGYGDSILFVTEHLTTLTVQSSVTVAGTSDTVNGCGGLVGKLAQAATVTWDLSKVQITNTANNTIGGTGATYVGGLFGVLQNVGNASTITLSATSTSSVVSSQCVDLNAKGYYGGLIGYYSSENLSSALVVDGLTVTSRLEEENKVHGGVIAKYVNDKAYASINDVVVNAYIKADKIFGGIVAECTNTVVGEYGLLDIATVDVNVTPVPSNLEIRAASLFGGIIGQSGYSVVRLSGTTDLTDCWAFRTGSGKRNTALLVGNNTNSLIYALGSGSDASTWLLKRPTSTAIAYSDLGQYGEVIRLNANMTESVSDSTDVFSYNPTAHTVTLHSLSYSIANVRDFAVYSIASDCSKAKATSALILTAVNPATSVALTSDISLQGTGLTALSHVQAFSGTLNGNNKTVTFATGEKYGTGNSAVSGQIYFQEKCGLFSDLSGTVSNVVLDGTFDIIGVENAGTVAATVVRNSTVSLENITVETTINDTFVKSNYFNPPESHTWLNNVGGVIGKAEKSTLSFDGITLSNELNVNNPKNDDEGAGGLLVSTLVDCDTTVSGITVDGASLDVQADENYAALTFGGLVYSATGRFHVVKDTNDVGISFAGSASSFKGKTKDSETSSLLICKGSDLYFILDNGALSISTQPTVTLTSGSYFDELVGNNIQGNHGIVSVETDHKGHLDESTISTYTHFLTNLYDNPNTRYYYDLLAICGNGTLTSSTINNAEQMMAFSVWQYASNNLHKYFVANPAGLWFASGTIDLSGYSYYPIDLNVSLVMNNATIILDYDRYYSKETQNKMPDDDQRQHYMLHSSVFYDVNTSLTVNGLTMRGTAGYINQCGALIQHNAEGTESNKLTLTINNLVLDGLSIVYPGGNVPAYAPLFINQIGSYTTLLVDGVSSSNYDVTSAVASSLIGNVGNTTNGKKISLSFLNIKLDGRTYDGAVKQWTVGDTNYDYNPGGTYNGPLFTKATLLNAFYYNDETSCSGIYNFNENEAIVTYGKEISYTASGREQYWFYDTFNDGTIVWDRTKSSTNDNSESDKTTYFIVGYLPYVYVVQDLTNKTLDLRVNQGANATAVGCGTYGHPYVISSDNIKWFYNISSFLNATDISTVIIKQVTVNQTVFDAEKFVTANYHTTPAQANGKDIDFKLENGTWVDLSNTYTITDQALFSKKMRRYLANAYYLFDSSSGTPIEINLDQSDLFTGIGGASCKSDNDQLAFAGVLIGSDSTSGTDINIHLNNVSAKHFGGLVGYANGCVVKNLNINYYGTINIDPSKAYETTGVKDFAFFGGVIGYVIGGDNIIDNVTVDYSNATVKIEGDYAHLANIGGYAGLVGGVISEKSSDYTVGSDGDVAFTAGGGIVFRHMASASGLGTVTYGSSVINVALEYSSTASQNYLYWNPYVGRVLDGYACYDAMTLGDGTSTSATLNNTNKNYYIPTIYDTAEASVEIEAISTDKRAAATTNWTINNEQGLWLLSSILNSGAGVHSIQFRNLNNVAVIYAYNIYQDRNADAAYTFGKARSTRATYDYVGQSISNALINDECYNENVWSGNLANLSNYGVPEYNYSQISYLVDKTLGGDGIATIGYNKFCNGSRGLNIYFSNSLDMSSYRSGFRGLGYSYSADGAFTNTNNGGFQYFHRTIVFDYFGSGANGTSSDTVRTITLAMERHEYETEQYYTLGVAFMPTLCVREVSGSTDTINALKFTGTVSLATWDFTGNQNGQVGEVGPSHAAHTPVGALFGKVGCTWGTLSIYINTTNVYLEDLTIQGGFMTGGLGGCSIGYIANVWDRGSDRSSANKLFVISDSGFTNLHVASNGFAGGLFGVAGSCINAGVTSSITSCTFEDSIIESSFSAPYKMSDKLFYVKYDNDGGGIFGYGCGGLFGAIVFRGGFVIEDVDIDNLTIQSTNKSTNGTDLTYRKDICAGIVGTCAAGATALTIDINNVTVQNCIIGHAQAEDGEDQPLVYNAAGIAGVVSSAGYEIHNSTIENNVIRWAVNLSCVVAEYRWGNATNNKGIADKLILSNNQLYTDHASLATSGINQGNSNIGGIVGYVFWSTPVTTHITLTDNTFVGCIMGSVYGCSHGANNTNISDILIDGGYYAVTWNSNTPWNSIKAAGIIGYVSAGAKTINLYNIYMKDLVMGSLIVNGKYCSSVTPALVANLDENNVGLYCEGKLRSYPTLLDAGKLTASVAQVPTDSTGAYIVGRLKFNDPVLNVTGLYMHSDNHYWPFTPAYYGDPNAGCIPASRCNIIYADYSGIQDVTTATDIAGVDINPQIAMPGITLYGNFVGDEFENIYNESKTSVVAENYWDCYFNTADLEFTAGSTDYNVYDFLHSASADGSGLEGEYYLSTYHTQETTTNVPAAYDFPVLVINAKDDNTIDSLLQNFICLLTNTTEVKGTIGLYSYIWSTDEDAFVVNTRATLLYDATSHKFSTNSYHNSNTSSFLLLRVTFANPTGGTDVLYLDIPIIVSKIMQFSVDMRVLPGTTYMAAPYEGITTIMVADHGDSFTLLMEYNYQRALTTWQSDLDNGINLLWSYEKELYLGEYPLPAGTRFALVDSTKKDRVYYYTANDEISQLDFSVFYSDYFGAWNEASMSEILGLTVQHEQGYYDVWSSGDDESLKTICVNGAYYKYNAEGTGEYSITIGATRVNSSDYLTNPERYFVTIQTPSSATSTINNLMGYGLSNGITPLVSASEDCIATKADQTKMHGTYRYLLTNSFSQEANVATTNPSEDMTEQNAIEATLECIIPAITGTEALEQFAVFHKYTVGDTMEMYQQFVIHLSEYDAGGDSAACFITANKMNWNYSLYDLDGNCIDTVAKLVALATANGYSVTTQNATAIINSLNETHTQNISGAVKNLSITYSSFEKIMNAIGKNGFKLVANVELVYENNLNKKSQFPNKVVSDENNQTGVGLSAWSKIAYSLDSLDNTGFAVGASDDKHFFLPGEDEEISLVDLFLTVDDVQTLSVNAIGNSSFDITAKGFYDYRMLNQELLDQAVKVRYTVSLLRKDAASERKIPQYVLISSPETYLEDGMTITHGTSVNAFTGTFDFEPNDEKMDKVTISCSPITGTAFEALEYRYGNFRILLKAELLDSSNRVLASTTATDYIVYTNAGISIDSLH